MKDLTPYQRIDIGNLRRTLEAALDGLETFLEGEDRPPSRHNPETRSEGIVYVQGCICEAMQQCTNLVIPMLAQADDYRFECQLEDDRLRFGRAPDWAEEYNHGED